MFRFEDYISRYYGQLVNSSHFIKMFYEKFKVATPLTDLTRTWLHSPGVPAEINNLNIIKDIGSNHFYIDVLDAFKEVTDLIQSLKKKKLRECSLEQDLRFIVGLDSGSQFSKSLYFPPYQVS